jgi:hypothetical protein
VEPITNWSPTIDFVSIPTVPKNFQCFDDDDAPATKKRKLSTFDRPERIFACTGRGTQGAISEFRYGYEARLRLDISGLDVPVTETWALPIALTGDENAASGSPTSLLFLLSLGTQSMLLDLAAEGNVIENVDQASTWLDLDSRTLAATSYNGLVVQITEKSIRAVIGSPM